MRSVGCERQPILPGFPGGITAFSPHLDQTVLNQLGYRRSNPCHVASILIVGELSEANGDAAVIPSVEAQYYGGEGALRQRCEAAVCLAFHHAPGNAYPPAPAGIRPVRRLLLALA